MDNLHLTREQIVLGMALAEMMKVNSFVRYERLQRLMKELHRKSQRHTYIIHRGDGLIETDREINPGVIAYWLGDSSGKYVFVKEHDGVTLSGMVVVQMYTTIIDNVAKIVMEVWPVTANSEPLAGTIWMEEGFANCGGGGIAPVFSTDCMIRPFPFYQFAGSVGGFSFGMVLFDDIGFDSKFVLGNMFKMVAAQLSGDPEKAKPQVITPLGVGYGEVKPEYPLTTKWLTRRPEGINDDQLKVLRFIFEKGVKIISQQEIYRFLTAENDMSSDEAKDVIEVVYAAVKAGWLMRVDYAQYFYYVPTPKLYAALS